MVDLSVKGCSDVEFADLVYQEVSVAPAVTSERGDCKHANEHV